MIVLQLILILINFFNVVFRIIIRRVYTLVELLQLIYTYIAIHLYRKKTVCIALRFQTRRERGINVQFVAECKINH